MTDSQGRQWVCLEGGQVGGADFRRPGEAPPAPTRTYMARHEWGRAEVEFREALRLDGSVAAYHAALGDVLVVVQRWAEAEAAYSAAVLLDVDNPEYRRALKEARLHP